VFNVTFWALLIICTFTRCTTIYHKWSEITQLATKYSGIREFIHCCSHQRYFKERGIPNVLEGIYSLRSSISDLSRIIISATPLNYLSVGSSIYVSRIESLCNTSCESNLPYSDVVPETPVRWLHRPELRQHNTYPISKISLPGTLRSKFATFKPQKCYFNRLTSDAKLNADGLQQNVWKLKVIIWWGCKFNVSFQV
jgi:hypothetical protein